MGAVSCEKPEYVDGSIKLLPANKAVPFNVASTPGANALPHQDLTEIGLQLGRIPNPLGSPSDIKIEASSNGIVNAVSVGFYRKRVNLVRRTGKDWRVLNISYIAGAH
jgi:hypothetical protein